jgi:hypothetical protein
MTVSKVLLSAVIALTLVPAAAQAADKSAPRTSAAAKSLSLSSPVRAGAVTGKKSHILGLGLLGSLLVAAGAVAAAVVVADAVDNGSSG